MDIPLSSIKIINWIRPYSEKPLAYKPRAIKNVNNHFYFNIEDCIHYDALKTGDYSTYDEQTRITYQDEHNTDKFKKLVSEWDMSKCQPIVLQWDPNAKLYVVHDGVHRMCIIKYKNIITDTIPTHHVQINFPKADIDKVAAALRATTGTQHANGWNNKRAEYGYHSFDIFNICFIGQRKPIERLKAIKPHVNFYNKSVLDIGCNTGGMLMHLPEISKGVGIDFDKCCIDAANTIADITKLHKSLKFIQGDLDIFDLDTLAEEGPFDIIFLCSMGSWIRDWKRLYMWALHTAPTIIFEENNETEGKPQIDFFTENGCILKKIIAYSPDDTTGNRLRNTYVITRAIDAKV